MCKRGITMAQSVCLFSLIILLVVFGYVSFALNLNISSNDDYSFKVGTASNSVTMVTLLFRHGDRNPTETYEKDPHKNYTWVGGYGALTKKGIKQMYMLGKIMNRRYKHLLPDEPYSKTVITVDSSAADRCLMSAASFLSAFWPPPTEWILPIEWQPIPIHYSSRTEDYLLAQKKKCERYESELKETYINETLEESFDINFDGFYDMLTHHTGQNVTNKLDVELLFNILDIEHSNGLELPEWTNSLYPTRLLNIAKKNLQLLTNTHFMKRIKGGSLIANMIQKMQSHIKNSEGTIAVYSAHDVTLVNFLRALGYDELLKPDYGATIALELDQVPGVAPTVQVLYFNDTLTTVPTIIPISSCSDTKLCTLTEFIHHLEVVTDILPSNNWNDECKIT
ncbi:prostatic acid phosphatase-like [Ctenocephalides felis]|uniref:prostatic acid phosphatase-like n=1 Tax=Ctenocephalides felis TaxID=7515 RepID=UPI000E6E5937|nr:prostatic acid phosphatase-like [Ctenocephalides felis]